MELRFVTYWIIFCGIFTDKNRLGLRAASNEQKLRIFDKYGNPSRHYTDGGTATALCASGRKPYVTVNGTKATKVIVADEPSALLAYTINITLDRNTVLGQYECHGSAGSKTLNRSLHRISYILCDTEPLVPAKLCTKGQFCVINGTETSCRAQLSCEGVSEPVECINGKTAKSTEDSCSVYNNAKINIQGYYLGPADGKNWCKANLRIAHKDKEKAVGFQSIVPISSSGELEKGQWSVTHKSDLALSCNMRISKGNQQRMKFDKSDFEAIPREDFPAKKSVACRAKDDDDVKGSTKFYLLFYDKNRAQFNLVQGEGKVDITNKTKDGTVRLQSKTPFSCTVTTQKGLFVKAVKSKGDSKEDPHSGSHSIDMGSSDGPTGKYTCIAKVYYYEQFGDIGYKLLYEEQRDVTINFTTTPITSTSTAAEPTGQPDNCTNGEECHGTLASEGLSTLASAAIAVTVVVVVAVIIGIVVLVLLLRKHHNEDPGDEGLGRDRVPEVSGSRKKKVNKKRISRSCKTATIFEPTTPSEMEGSTFPTARNPIEERRRSSKAKTEERSRRSSAITASHGPRKKIQSRAGSAPDVKGLQGDEPERRRKKCETRKEKMLSTGAFTPEDLKDVENAGKSRDTSTLYF